jgi:putative CocE/NonD family hydrolase
MRNTSRIVLVMAIFCFGASSIQANEPDSVFNRNTYVKTEVMIPMRDGVKLFTSIYYPKDTTTAHPVLLRRSPYSCAPYGPDNFRRRLTLTDVYCAKRKYILVTQDVRGRFMSEGQFEDVRPYKPMKSSTAETDESSDAYDTVEWLVKHVPGNNGRVGISGISYPGFYAWMGSIDAHPAVKATSPQAPVSEWMGGDDFFHNGAFLVSHAFDFFSGFGWPRSQPVQEYPTRFSHRLPDGYASYLSMGTTAALNEKFLHDSVEIWNQLARHSKWDSFWEERSILPHLDKITPAVLVVGGWYDTENLFGALNSYSVANRMNANNRISLVMGPWPHGWWETAGLDSLGDIKYGSTTSEYFVENIEGPFFDHYLNNGPDPGTPEAWMFRTGTNEWKKLQAWPPTSRKTKEIFLRDGGRLASTPPEYTKEQFDEYTSDPRKPVPYTSRYTHWYKGSFMNEDQRFAARRPDVLVYQTEPLTADITVAGPFGVNLFASTSGTDCDWIIKVIDVYPDELSETSSNGTPMGGYQMLVRGDVLRGKFRNSLEKPEPFKPNVATQIQFRLQDAFHTFKKGHRIMVQVQSTWFPMIDRNPGKFMDIFKAKEADLQKTTQRVYHSAGMPSAISVEVVE